MSASNVSVSNVETVFTVVDQSTNKGDAVQAVHQLLDGVTPSVPIAEPSAKAKKPRAPKKVKEAVVVEGEASVEGDAPSVPIAEPSTKAKKPRAPKKVKEAVVEGEAPSVPIAEPSTKAKKPRAPKKVKEAVVEGEAPSVLIAEPSTNVKEAVVEGEAPSVPIAEPSTNVKKPRAPKKVKEVLVPEEVVRSSTPTMPNIPTNSYVVFRNIIRDPTEQSSSGSFLNTIEQCINAIKYLNRTEGKTCDQIKQMVDDFMMKDEPEATIPKNYVGVQRDMELELAFDDMKIGDASTDIGLEKMDVEKEVVEEEVVEEKVEDEEVEDEEVEEELLTTEFTLDGEIYLKDSKDNLYDRSPPHDFIRNLRE